MSSRHSYITLFKVYRLVSFPISVISLCLTPSFLLSDVFFHVFVLTICSLFYCYIHGIPISFYSMFSSISMYVIHILIHKILHNNCRCVISIFISYLIYLHNIWGCDLGECCFPFYVLACCIFVMVLI